MVGLSRFELLTPRLSSVCSNQLSYRPSFLKPALHRNAAVSLPPSWNLSKNRPAPPRGRPGPIPSKLDRRARQQYHRVPDRSLRGFRLWTLGCWQCQKPRARGLEPYSRKEVIQPQVLLQLPCYDFTPITDHTLGACPPCGLAQLLLVQPAFVM